MTPFQWLALVAIALVVAGTLRAATRGHIRKRITAMWLVVWTCGGVAVAWPESTMMAARALGIGRGADLVLYLSVVLNTIGFFFVYTRFRRVDRQLTLLARSVAIGQPRRPPEPPQQGTAVEPFPAPADPSSKAGNQPS